jgi:hypothetical protein
MHASRLPVQEQAAVHTCRGTEEERAIWSRLLDRLCVTEISYRTIPIDLVRAAIGQGRHMSMCTEHSRTNLQLVTGTSLSAYACMHDTSFSRWAGPEVKRT